MHGIRPLIRCNVNNSVSFCWLSQTHIHTRHHLKHGSPASVHRTRLFGFVFFVLSAVPSSSHFITMRANNKKICLNICYNIRFLLIQFHTKNAAVAPTHTLLFWYTKIQINNEQKSQRERESEWVKFNNKEWEWNKKIITWWNTSVAHHLHHHHHHRLRVLVGFSGLLSMPHFYFSMLMALFLLPCCWWWVVVLLLLVLSSSSSSLYRDDDDCHRCYGSVVVTMRCWS